MAITGSNLTSGAGTAATSFATASITPTSKALVLVAVSQHAASAPASPTVSGNSLTYVQVDAVNYDVTGNWRTTLFRALGTSPSAGTITIDFAGVSQTAVVWSVDQF